MIIRPYLKYFYDVIAIVIGITISYIVDEYRVSKQNRKVTIQSLKLIRKDLVEMSYNISFINGELSSFQYQNQFMKNLEDVDSILNMYRYSFWIDRVEFHKSGITSLVGKRKYQFTSKLDAELEKNGSGK